VGLTGIGRAKHRGDAAAAQVLGIGFQGVQSVSWESGWRRTLESGNPCIRFIAIARQSLPDAYPKVPFAARSELINDKNQYSGKFWNTLGTNRRRIADSPSFDFCSIPHIVSLIFRTAIG
jgi:hypothetical protein